MADGDPDLAAKLLAAFSAPTGALPVPDLSSLSYEGWHWDSCDDADLISEQKVEPQTETEPAHGLDSTKQEHTSPAPSPERPLGEGPSQPEPSQQARSEQQEGPGQRAASHQGSVPREVLPRETLSRGPSPQQPVQQGNVQHEPSTQLPSAPEPPPSPQKRSRSLNLETDKHESIAEKRLKMVHHDLEQRDVDLSAANWDISAMIENALGSFDQQSHQPHAEHSHHRGEGPASEPSQSKPQLPRKGEHKRMKFSSNPYYVMRTMSLPLLGSLVSQCPVSLNVSFSQADNSLFRPSKYCSRSLSSPAKSP